MRDFWKIPYLDQHLKRLSKRMDQNRNNRRSRPLKRRPLFRGFTVPQKTWGVSERQKLVHFHFKLWSYDLFPGKTYLFWHSRVQFFIKKAIPSFVPIPMCLETGASGCPMKTRADLFSSKSSTFWSFSSVPLAKISSIKSKRLKTQHHIISSLVACTARIGFI